MRLVDIPSRDQALHLKNMEMVKGRDFGEDVTTCLFRRPNFNNLCPQKPCRKKQGGLWLV